MNAVQKAIHVQKWCSRCKWRSPDPGVTSINNDDCTNPKILKSYLNNDHTIQEWSNCNWGSKLIGLECIYAVTYCESTRCYTKTYFRKRETK